MKLQNYLPELEIEKITNENIDQIVDIYHSNVEFFMLSDGKLATIDNCLSDMNSIPLNFNKESKIYLGFFKSGKAVAVLDCLMGYPDNQTAWIGLLLVDTLIQGQTIGQTIIQGLVSMLKDEGYKSVQLGVIDKNLKALNFWNKCSFNSVREAKDLAHPDLKIIIMERKLFD